MNGKQILELKKKYDAIAYIPYENNDRLGNKKVYFRAPTVFEYATFTANDKESTKYDCVQKCVISVNDGDEEDDIDFFLDFVQENNNGYILVLFDNIIRLSPLSDEATCVKEYKIAKDKQKLLLNSIKLDFLLTFRDFRLAEACENFSYKKFIEYVVMLEETKNTQGLFISDLVGDQSLMEPQVKQAIDDIMAANKKQQRQPKNPQFPKNIQNIDPKTADPAIQNALQAAQIALRSKLAQDAADARLGKKSYVNFDQENAESKTI